EDLRIAIVAANVAGPKGALDGTHQSYTIGANDQILAAEAYRDIIVAYRNGAPVLLGDVARIVDGLENNRVGGWYQGVPAVSLDNLSLMALTIGTGFVVDDAIVMIENIVRHMEKGEKPFEAALRGASEIGFTVISLTMSLIAVFIPLLFMTGLVGRMFREFALTLTIAVVVSAIVSLTLTPMMCSRILRHKVARAGNPVGRFFNRAMDRTVEVYGQSLQWVLRHQGMTLLITLATLVATVWLYVAMPKGFLPSQDTGLISAVSEA